MRMLASKTWIDPDEAFACELIDAIAFNDEPSSGAIEGFGFKWSGKFWYLTRDVYEGRKRKADFYAAAM